MKFSDIPKRIIGIGIASFSIQWVPPDDYKKIAKEVLTFLENKRVLYSPYELEVPHHCIESINEIRNYLTQQIPKASGCKELEDILKIMRRKCIDFVNYDQNHRFHFGRMMDEYILCVSLGELRANMGLYIKKMVLLFELDIDDELYSICPTDDY